MAAGAIGSMAGPAIYLYSNNVRHHSTIISFLQHQRLLSVAPP
jgi:hypothetical protein